MSDPVLPECVRLRTRREFLTAKRAGLRWRGAVVRIEVRRRSASETPASGAHERVRIGFTATRVSVGNAVRRNRARRRLRAATAATPCALFVRGCDYVVLARREILCAPWPALVADLACGLGAVSAQLAIEQEMQRALGTYGGRCAR